MALTQDSLVACIRENSGIDEAIEADTSLFSSGMLDSVAMLNLIMFVEQQSSMEVRAEDVTLENFDTPARILEFAAKVAA